MKTALGLVLLLASAGPAWACGGGCPLPKQAAASEAATATFDVAGMTCAGCARSIEKSLAKLDGVQEASLDFEAATATVTYDPSAVTPAQLEATIDGLGFDATLRPTQRVEGQVCASGGDPRYRRLRR